MLTDTIFINTQRVIIKVNLGTESYVNCARFIFSVVGFIALWLET